MNNAAEVQCQHNSTRLEACSLKAFIPCATGKGAKHYAKITDCEVAGDLQGVKVGEPTEVDGKAGFWITVVVFNEKGNERWKLKKDEWVTVEWFMVKNRPAAINYGGFIPSAWGE